MVAEVVVAAPKGLSVKPVETEAAEGAAGAAEFNEPPTCRRGYKKNNNNKLICGCSRT